MKRAPALAAPSRETYGLAIDRFLPRFVSCRECGTLCVRGDREGHLRLDLTLLEIDLAFACLGVRGMMSQGVGVAKEGREHRCPPTFAALWPLARREVR